MQMKDIYSNLPGTGDFKNFMIKDKNFITTFFFCFRFPNNILEDQGSISVMQHVVSVESSSFASS